MQELIAEIYKGVDTRIQMGRRKAEDQIILTERQIRSIHALENECKEVFSNFCSMLMIYETYKYLEQDF